MLQEFQDAIGRAWRENRAADDKPADIVKVKAVDIFIRRYGAQDAGHVERSRQRQLDQNAVHRRVLVELGDLGNDFVLFHIGRIIKAERTDANVDAGADLVFHIDPRSRIGADNNDGQSRRHARLCNDALHALPAFVPDAAGDRVAIDDLCGHACPNAMPVAKALVLYSLTMRRE